MHNHCNIISQHQHLVHLKVYLVSVNYFWFVYCWGNEIEIEHFLLSILGRRTPLGTVGLGGFFAQPHAASSSAQSDENKPSSASHIAHLLEQSSSAGGSSSNSGGKQKNRQGKSVRLNINARW